MKLKSWLGVGMLAAPFAAAGAANAQAGPAPAAPAAEKTSYVSFSIGRIGDADYSYSVQDTFPVDASVGDGYVIEAAYGRHFGDHWRGEIAVTWQDRDNANSSWVFGTNLTGPGMSAYTLDAIAYYDIPINDRLNVYAGAGLGIANVTLDDGVVTDSTGAGLHLQALAGVEAKMSDGLSLFADVRLKSMHPSIEGGTAGASGRVDDNFDITSTAVQAGFKVAF